MSESMPLRDTDRVALVTGADRNLGKAMAMALLDEGVRVVLTALSEDDLKSVVAECGDAAPRARVVAGNVGREADRNRILKAAFDAFGRIDILVNNAAVTPETFWPDWLVVGEPRQWTLDIEFYRNFLEIDTIAPHAFMLAAIPGMIDRGWGRVVNITTGLNTMLKFWPYGSAKAALEAQTAVLAEQLRGTGVTANVLIPGAFAKPEPLNVGAGHVITPKFGPDIMSAPMRWLASNASDGITAKRILAAHWGRDRSAGETVEDAIFPIAWTGYGEKSIDPTVA